MSRTTSTAAGRLAEGHAQHYGMRRLRIRWERRDDIHEALLGLATCIITWRHIKILC